MKTFFVVTLALCCLAIFTPAHAWTKLDVENFILGLGEGLENDFSQNITLCIKDEMTAFQEFETAFNDLKAGIKHKSVHEIRVGLQALGNGLKDASAILKDCGFETMAADIEHIAKSFSEGWGGIVEIIIKDLVRIWVKRKDVTTEFETAIQAWHAANYRLCGKNVGMILGLFLEGDTIHSNGLIKKIGGGIKKVVTGSKCSVCTTAVQIIANTYGGKVGNVAGLISKACGNIPVASDLCRSFLSSKAQQIGELLASGQAPSKVCAVIRLC